MKRFALAVLAALALAPLHAFGAAATWDDLAGLRDSRVGTCAAGTSCDAPSAATDGATLGRVGSSVDVYVCADSGQTITDGNGFDVYFYDAAIGLWAKFNSSPYTVPTGSRCGYLQGDSPGKGIPILAKRGRIAVVPNAAAVSSGALTIYLIIL